MKIKFFFTVIISLLVYGSVSAQSFAQNIAPQNVPTTRSYQLGPGDEVTIKVLNEEQFSFVATVNDDGKIKVPYSDKRVVAKCRTEDEVGADVSSIFGKYLKEPQLSIQVKKNSRPPASIYGEVNSPQQVMLYRKSTLREFISMAGGVKEEAGGTVQIFRTQAPMCTDAAEDTNWKTESSNPNDEPSRIYSLANLSLGKEGSDPTIYPGDVIFVHRAVPVYITGEVLAPQGIYLKEGGLSLTEAIAKIGGIRPGAKTKDIKIHRLKSNLKDDREVLTANYDLIKSGKQKDIMLQPNDIVEVDKAKESVGLQIFKFAIGVGKAGVMAVGTGGGYRVLY